MRRLYVISTVMVLLICMALPAFAQNETCWEQKSPGAVCAEKLTGMEFIWIPGGSFKMGSELLVHRSDELPAHMVELDGFWIGKTEVTNAQYRHWKPDHDSKEYEGHPLNGDTQPAVFVSWEDANAFAEWLTKQHNGRYTFRLPSEAQWEYAARAGTTTSRFWGDDPDDACHYANVHDRSSEQEFDWDFAAHNCDDGYAVTAPVGSFQANAFGLYDMLGNVKEWCADWYDRYAYRSDSHKKRNPLVSEGGMLRVLRGGMWDSSSPGFVRSAIRHRTVPDDRIYNIGFRLIVMTNSIQKMQLRSEPWVVAEDEASEKFGLTEWDWKPLQYVQNDFEDQGETVI